MAEIDSLRSENLALAEELDKVQLELDKCQIENAELKRKLEEFAMLYPTTNTESF